MYFVMENTNKFVLNLNIFWPNVNMRWNIDTILFLFLFVRMCVCVCVCVERQ